MKCWNCQQFGFTCRLAPGSTSRCQRPPGITLPTISQPDKNMLYHFTKINENIFSPKTLKVDYFLMGKLKNGWELFQMITFKSLNLLSKGTPWLDHLILKLWSLFIAPWAKFRSSDKRTRLTIGRSWVQISSHPSLDVSGVMPGRFTYSILVHLRKERKILTE